MPEHGLSTQQLDVISALSSGATITAAAEQAGVHRNTITNWRSNLLPFQHALEHAQYDRALFFREKVESQVDLAIQTIHQLLTDPNTPASVRLKAALAIIEMAATPPPPRKQTDLDFETIQVNPSQSETVAGIVHKNAQSPIAVQPPSLAASSPRPTAPPVPKSAQSPLRRVHLKTGRNEACPCGSGKKFKRCCIDQPGLSAAA